DVGEHVSLGIARARQRRRQQWFDCRVQDRHVVDRCHGQRAGGLGDAERSYAAGRADGGEVAGGARSLVPGAERELPGAAKVAAGMKRTLAVVVLGSTRASVSLTGPTANQVVPFRLYSHVPGAGRADDRDALEGAG